MDEGVDNANTPSLSLEVEPLILFIVGRDAMMHCVPWFDEDSFSCLRVNLSVLTMSTRLALAQLILGRCEGSGD